MNEEMRTCPVCGKTFVPRRPVQKYCSSGCRRYANRHGANDVREEMPVTAPVIREFNCLKCGKTVRVTNPADGRMKFCSQHCEKLFWKHSKKVKPLTVYRQFVCRQCGKNVLIVDPLDRRRFFCSRQCRVRWFIEQNKAKKKDENEKTAACQTEQA